MKSHSNVWLLLQSVAAANSTLLTFSLENKLVAPQVVGKVGGEYVSHSTFIGSFEIGTPPQKVPLIVDLISDVFWIVGNDANCTYPPCDAQFTFDYTSSSSYVASNDSKGFQITNPLPVQSVVQCGNSYDTLTIGNLSVPSVPVCLAWDIQSEFSFSAGRIGLSPRGGILSILNETNQISPIASIWFNQTVYEPNYSQFGYITLGGIDPTLLVDGTIKWIGLSRPKDPKWYLNITAMQYESLEFTESFEITLDLNEPLSYIPHEFFQQIVDANPSIKKPAGSNYYIVNNCKNTLISPLTIAFGETTIEIAPRQMIYPINGICLFAFAPNPSNKSSATMGYYILQNFYTILDFGNAQVGFGQSSGLNGNMLPSSCANLIPSYLLLLLLLI
ncbi:hypothetical protein HDV06_004982 [Boothiomyces sp. JEL0866]|nr:hypothetical protein HDV06_004949 [Boothiomyces sp. JEL0866]KAJ3325225.1 hypothetical protein HDV06_004982 [Boothiomyces sp. JEL0866]